MTNKIITEEAIKRLKKSIACMESGHTCPFNIINGCKSCESYVTDEQTIEATEAAIEALEYREPRKPELYGDGYADGNLVLDQWECARCGYIGEVENEHPNYCPNCGQNIDWEEEDD